MANSERPVVQEHKNDTGEVIERPMTDEEFAAWQIDVENDSKRQAEAEAREAARQATLEKLAALGLTADDLKALLNQEYNGPHSRHLPT